MQITLSDSVEGLQDLLDAYNAAAKRFGLKINAGKTEVLWVFYIDEVPYKISIVPPFLPTTSPPFHNGNQTG